MSTINEFLDTWEKGSYGIYTINENAILETGKDMTRPHEIILDMGRHQIRYEPGSVEKLVSFLKSRNIISKC
jgi:hypothetical protein